MFNISRLFSLRSLGMNDNNVNPWGKAPEWGVKTDSNVRRDKAGYGFNGSNGGQGGGGNIPPDLFSLITPFRAIAVLLIIILGILASGIYVINPSESGLILRFGKWTRTSDPGIHWRVPFAEELVKISVERVRQSEIGGTSSDNILTGDQNIISIDCSIFWKIKDPRKFMFNMINPASVVETAGQSAMRQAVASFNIQEILSEGRDKIQMQIMNMLQSVLDSYNAGISITAVQLQNARPPEEVIDAFNDVQRAMQDRDKVRNQAEGYRNGVIPKARGKAYAILEEANAYMEQQIYEAKGYAARMKALYEQYKANRTAIKAKLYTEILGEIYGSIDKVIISPDAGVLNYLPIQEIINKNNKKTYEQDKK